LDSATFIIRDEDHTLGNALRYVLMKKWNQQHSLSFHFLNSFFSQSDCWPCWLHYPASVWTKDEFASSDQRFAQFQRQKGFYFFILFFFFRFQI
jgi:hypothetical protein